MKRRNFMGLFGAAIAAPLMPLPALGNAAGEVYAKSAMHGAILHAQARVSFSVWGLAKTLGVSVAQAETLMGDMAKRGILGPLQGTTHGGRWATSNILQKEMLGAVQAAKKAHQSATHQTSQKHYAEPDLGQLLAHLRGLCEKQGMTLHPRCAA
ncbi:MAG: hypothetical protein KC448_09835 [Yoonia sp.]|nr:hypothetical protein [Yoonia sp.]